MNKNYHIGGSNLIDAKLEEHQMWGTKQCPSCGYKLERKPQDWLGLPAGVKFDPTDQELIDHLEGQVKDENFKSHPLIDEFIPTIEGEDGICYTHPEKLPGVTRGGLSRHFFHRPSKAYTTGTRKRRKIQTECDLQGSETRWHKTGKTRPVMANGKQKGCKKILVLYTNFGKHRKPVKTNWVMHQYHLGQFEEEKEGELVVSKIFYQTQPRQSNWSDQIIRTIKGGGKGSGELKSRRESNSGSCSSSKEIGTQRDELSGGVSTGVSSYNSMDIQQLNSDHFSFVPFRKSFDEVGFMEEAISTAREYTSCRRAWDENEDHHHRQHISTFHVSLPSFPISSTISPPHHHTSIVLDEGSYNNPSTIPKNDKFRQQHHDHQHKVVGGSSPTGLEEMLMFYTSSSDIKEERAMTNPRGAEWLKYSSYLPDPDNQDHHG